MRCWVFLTTRCDPFVLSDVTVSSCPLWLFLTVLCDRFVLCSVVGSYPLWLVPTTAVVLSYYALSLFSPVRSVIGS